MADTLSRRSPPSVGGGGGVWVEHRALRGVWCRSIRGMDRDDCFVSASIMMCGRCAVAYRVTAAKTGKYPLQIQNIVNIVKYRQNMIANKFYLRMISAPEARSCLSKNHDH